jgi:hypothetical protein
MSAAAAGAGGCGLGCILPTMPGLPFLTELCGNGLDDDGDTLVDDSCSCEVGGEQRCFSADAALAGVGACKWGVQRCLGDASSEFRRWGKCEMQGAPSAEQCDDGVDNDCDGEVDEGCGCKEGEREACANDRCWGERVCRNHSFSECSARTPSAELCNGIDDDCDGNADDLPEEACTGACGAGRRSCVAGAWSSCSAPAPEAESCNGIDDDCDGVIDDVPEMACSSTCGSGRRRCVNGVWSSCSAPSPKTESCNGVDDDCDGTIDDLANQACSSACGSGIRSCEDGAWSSCSAPAPETEICNGMDDDCDGVADDGLIADWDFVNRCSDSRVFLVFGGCNVCSGSCNGRWVDPGESYTYRLEQSECITISAFARTSNGDQCLEENGAGDYVGETRELCSRSCRSQDIPMQVTGGDGC